ncbi:hypothetical protein GGR61_002768 [Xanthomonas arboricola]|nr:hypothetical protein [Xanthomonas sp. 3058]
MKDMKADERRRFLSGAVAIALLAASPIAAYSAEQADTTTLPRAIPKKQIVRGEGSR